MPLSDQILRARPTGQEFLSTHWSMVLLAGQESSPRSDAALAKLCEGYWYPLYAYTRRQGYAPPEAADLTQDFFSHILATRALATVKQEKGKFRSFLIASLKNLLANEWNRSRAQKRGGGAAVFSLDEDEAESRYQSDLADGASPDRLYDRRWAETILARALDRLREECDAGEKLKRFDDLKTFLLGERTGITLASCAESMGLSLPAAKAIVHRLRRRFRDLIREEIAQTVATKEDIEQEIRDLFTAFER